MDGTCAVDPVLRPAEGSALPGTPDCTTGHSVTAWVRVCGSALMKGFSMNGGDVSGELHDDHVVFIPISGIRLTGRAARDASQIGHGDGGGSLIDAYLDTRYQVDGADVSHALRIGKPIGNGPGSVGDIIGQAGAMCGAFITAWNPHSDPTTTPEANLAAGKRLMMRMQGFPHVTVHPGNGIGTDCTWPPEPSVFAVGLGEDDAIVLGREFGQNAIVWVGRDGVPRLLLLR